jgi:hypothetical protein
MSSGYEQIYLGLKPRLAECDLAESARRLGLSAPSNGEVAVAFCGRDFLITCEGVNPADGEPVDVNYLSVLAYYILSKGSGEPEHTFMPLGRMTGMIDGRNAHDKGLLLKPLIRNFGDHYNSFERAARQLGGVPDDVSTDGGHGWRFQVLPKIPVRLVFYEADEEFPADIQLFFDTSARRFLEFECLAFLSGCFIKALCSEAREIVAAG